MTGTMTIRTAVLVTALAAAAAGRVPAAEPPSPSPGAPAGEGAPTATVQQMAWLAGCWESRDERGHTEEQWMAPEGRTLIGMSRTVRNGKTIAWENLRIEEKDGRLIFTARPSSQPEASFPLRSLDAAGAVFENPDHDFPQRVIYRRGPDGGLHGRIEGVNKGKPAAVDFPMRRVACPGSPAAAPAQPGPADSQDR